MWAISNGFVSVILLVMWNIKTQLYAVELLSQRAIQTVNQQGKLLSYCHYVVRNRTNQQGQLLGHCQYVVHNISTNRESCRVIVITWYINCQPRRKVVEIIVMPQYYRLWTKGGRSDCHVV